MEFFHDLVLTDISGPEIGGFLFRQNGDVQTWLVDDPFLQKRNKSAALFRFVVESAGERQRDGNNGCNAKQAVGKGAPDDVGRCGHGSPGRKAADSYLMSILVVAETFGFKSLTLARFLAAIRSKNRRVMARKLDYKLRLEGYGSKFDVGAGLYTYAHFSARADQAVAL